MTENELRLSVATKAKELLGVKKGSNAHRVIIDIYNSLYPDLPLRNGKPYKLTYSDNWCAGFISYLSIILGLTDILPVECSCTEMIKLHKALDQWVEDDAYTPKVGDLIMYYWKDGTNYAITDQKNPPNHVGIVVEVKGNTITVIEGNKGTESIVGTRQITINGRYIRGYCCPNYASKVQVNEPWYAEEMRWGKWIGIHDGTRPEDPCSRAEVSTMLHNLYKALKGEVS